MAQTFTDTNFTQEVLGSALPAVVDFWAAWCGPCRAIAPFIDEIAAEYEGKVLVGKVDVDSCPDIVAKYGIRNIPTVLFIKNGEIVDKVVGAATKMVFKSKTDALLA
jgi:thioredoxin 1